MAAESGHRRRNKHENTEVPIQQVDYQFPGRDGQLVEEACHPDWPMVACVPRKTRKHTLYEL